MAHEKRRSQRKKTNFHVETMKKKLTLKQALKKVEGSKEDKKHDKALARKLMKKK